MVRVVVLGAGVIGLSSALHLLERFPGAFDLTVVAEKFTPNTNQELLSFRAVRQMRVLRLSSTQRIQS